MANFSSQEIDSQYNFIKIIFSDKTKYKVSIEEIKKDISYMLLELKKMLENENIVLQIKDYYTEQSQISLKRLLYFLI